MTAVVGQELDKAHHAINGKQDAGQGVKQDAKQAQLAAVTVDPLAKDGQTLTSAWGAKHASHDHTLAVVSEGRTGPHLLEDNYAREKIHRFDHERIPERVVHARGAGAFGTFRLFESAADVSSAGVLTDTARETPVFVRFSTVQGSRGSGDTVRDVRGFAVKFYTDEGNWDIVGNDIPIFFIQDSIKFSDIVHAVKPAPDREVPQGQSAHNNFWDFVYLHSEATHMYMWTMSDRGIPRSYRMMQGFGVNTYTLVNAAGERTFVKFIFTPALGVHSFVWDEALKLAGQDPDFHRKDLYEAIDNGAFPKWRFGIQCLSEAQQDDFDFDILDATKVWPEEQVPIRYIGELELNRNVDEYFTQTEQVAFCTSHVVPGIGFSDDPLLQGRNFSYFDTQLSRLGTNWQELPINRPLCPVMNNNRDGQGRHTITKGSVNYYPNRFGAVPPTQPNDAYYDYPQKVAGIKARLKSSKFAEHYSQAQLFYNSLAPHEKQNLTAALSFELDHCEDPVVYERMSQRLADVDLALAQAVAEQVGGTVPQTAGRPNHGRTAKGLSMTDFAPAVPTIQTRRIALIIADGFDEVAFNAVRTAVKNAGALPFVIGPRRSAVVSAGGQSVKPDHHLEGMRSTMFDALFVPGGAKSAETLRKTGRAVHWVREAFGHLKAICATGEAVQLVRDAAAVPGLVFSNGSEVQESYGVVTAAKVPPESWSEEVEIAETGTGLLEQYFYAISQHKNWARQLDGLSVQVAY